MSDSLPDPGARSNRQLNTRIRLIKGDLVAQEGVDAIVAGVPADLDLRGSLLHAVIAAAGHDLDEFILSHFFKPQPGDTLVAPGFGLKAGHVILVVMPPRRDRRDYEDRHVLHAFRHALVAAQNNGFRRVAFPALGTGESRFPPARAARLALQGIRERLNPSKIDEVRIVCNRDETYQAFREKMT